MSSQKSYHHALPIYEAYHPTTHDTVVFSEDKVPTWCHWPSWPFPFEFDVPSTEPHQCPYHPEQTRIDKGFMCKEVPGDIYEELMNAGFRRSGDIFYQPNCPTCRACRPMRVPVNSFKRSKSQRKTWRRNRDLTVTVLHPNPTDEKFDIYQRYAASRHDDKKTPTYEEMTNFLYTSPTSTIELETRDPETDQLIGVGIADITPNSLSTVYFYFDPDPQYKARSLGTWSILWEIDFAKRNRLKFYYLGFTLPGVENMKYKTRYKPYQVLGPDGVWYDVVD